MITAFKAGREGAYLKRLYHNVERINEKNANPYHLSISTGVVVCDPASICTIEDILKDADLHLYEQKAASQKAPSKSS